MRSRATADFWRRYRRLPLEIQRRAKNAYLLFQNNSSHLSLEFKRVGPKRKKMYSVRVNLFYRVIGKMSGDEIIWEWIGPHDEYDRIVDALWRR